MGSDDEFGPDTETIRAWLSKRATYAKDARVIGSPRGGTLTADPTAPSSTNARSAQAPPVPSATRLKELRSQPDATDAGRSVLSALGVEAESAPPRTSADSTRAGRSVVDALRADPAAAPSGRGKAPRAKEAKAKEPKESRRERRKDRHEPVDQPNLDVLLPASPATPAAEPPSTPAPSAPAAPAARTPLRRPTPTTEPPTRATVVHEAGAARISAPAPRRTTDPATSRRPAPSTAAPAPARPTTGPGRWTEPEENRLALEATTDVDFPVRHGVRRALSWVLLATLAATAVTAYVAQTERTPATIAAAGGLGFLCLVVWAVRAGCTTTQLSIRRGQLHIKRAGRTDVVDIGSHYTPVAIVGEPGQRHWTVLAERSGLPLIVINASMVDPHWFTSALYRLRPELRPGYVSEDAVEASIQ